ncbi:MotA/TolQ/ExbB proton channel family protein [Rhodobacteraceae bacterium KMM 6894]|nr:MotA/TolQ/ExbB proton channel family protein [Rhodobacteraceae bacterium KMM 6894]
MSTGPDCGALHRAVACLALCAVLGVMPVVTFAQQANPDPATSGATQSSPLAQVEAPAEPPAPDLLDHDQSAHSGGLDISKPDTPVLVGEVDVPQARQPDVAPVVMGTVDQVLTFLRRGGPAIWSITLLSVVALALILWKVWRLALLGAWSGGRRAQRAVTLWTEGREQEALTLLQGRKTCRAILARTAMTARRDVTLDDDGARAETERVARNLIARGRDGLRPLELISTIAPLLGLLGTVMGMIAAFQALQEAGSRADPAILAGGIWEALLTTAAGMAVAIPASMALTWFESIVDRLRRDMEDAATRIFLRPVAQDTAQTRAAE